MNIIVTGGAGFIGSNFLRLFVPRHPEHSFINVDKLTYAANPLNLENIKTLPNYSFEQTDITNYIQIEKLFEKYKPELVFHFAAESHVDRSIAGPKDFIETNINGTFNLLETCRRFWLQEPTAINRGKKADNSYKKFIHVSTDEVYGSLGSSGLFTERTPYDPSSPYSASKAASDHLVRAYNRTYGLPVVITNCSNNYGPYQFPEKLIPLMIINGLEGKALPVYGKGENVRDWLFVEDHCRALWITAEKGENGETYNIGGSNEWKNIDLIHALCDALAAETGKPAGHYKKLIEFVPDRPGHDLRYAIDSSKIKDSLGWQPQENFESGLQKTVRWYINNPEWLANIITGSYRRWIEKNYTSR